MKITSYFFGLLFTAGSKVSIVQFIAIIITYFWNSKIEQSPNNNNIITCRTYEHASSRGQKCPGVNLSQAPKRLEEKRRLTNLYHVVDGQKKLWKVF